MSLMNLATALISCSCIREEQMGTGCGLIERKGAYIEWLFVLENIHNKRYTKHFVLVEFLLQLLPLSSSFGCPSLLS